MKRIAIFDFDKTITTVDSFNDFLKYTFGSRRFYLKMLTHIGAITLYKLGIYSNAKVKSKIFQSFYEGRTFQDYLSDCKKYSNERLDKIINPIINSIITNYKENNIEMIILSASFKEWIEPWAKRVGIQTIICSQFEIKDDKIIGNILEDKSCHGKNKPKLLKSKITNLNEYGEIITYGDSKSDLYFMNLGNTKYKVNKKEIKLIDEYAIVTDGLWRKSVSAIRSVGKKGIKVYVTGDTYLSTGMWSRYCYKKQKVVSFENQEKSLTNVIKNTNKKAVLFPMEESTILWCAQNKSKIEKDCYFLIPSLASLNIALNKSATIKQAIKENIPCPKTYFPKDANELKNMIKNLDWNDYVVKPYRGSGSSGLLYGTESKNIDLIEHWKKYGELVLQERVPSDGEPVGVSIIMNHQHEVIAHFAHKRIEQYPNSGGPSTQRIGIENKKLVEKSIKLLKSLNWVGIAMVEWKFNSNTNEFVLMEINPRFWGSLELAVRSGVDFPFIYYQLSKKRFVQPITSYKTDYNCRWLLPGDILRYLTKKDRESIFKFFKGILKNSEEWDKKDKRGFFASIWCQALLVINPKYWKYIRR